MVILCLMLAVGSCFALPSSYSSKGNPALCKQLMYKAETNLKLLPNDIKQQYQALLQEHPDAVMAYLLAYESDSNLAAAKPEYVHNNYLQIVNLLDSRKPKLSPEFFLSYVAKQTVSDEAITPYRKALLDDGLQDILDENTQELELFRAVTLWCVSRLQFQQTSGRDQTPLDITQRSYTGRCEEMQILLVAAARTVGLPARPASAPWWAHMDNNHAWAEIWLDNAWHYTGDMDAAWFPDQTWFSGMIDKTVLILAEGSLAAENDEILDSGKYETVINSTRNYAKERTRTLTLHVTDEKGKPVSGAQVVPMVFNWGSLRALSYLTTDKKGHLHFSCGRGAFYLSVYHKGKKALRLVPSGTDEQVMLNVQLTSQDYPPENAILEYPSNPMQWQNPPDEYRKAVQTEKDRWKLKNDNDILQVKAWLAPADSLAYQTALACKGNWHALQEFMDKQPGVDAGFWEFLLSYDPKFLWQANSTQIQALYNFYETQKPYLTGSEEDLSLLSPTVYYEELPQPWKGVDGQALLYPPDFKVSGAEPKDKIEAVIKLLNNKHKIDAKKALSGLPSLELVYQQKYLNSYQFRILACSMLRANGFPAEFSRLPNLVTVFINGDWEYLNVVTGKWENRNSESSANMVVKVRLADADGIPIQASEEQLNLCRYVEGSCYPLAHPFTYLGQGWHQATFAREKAYLQFGYRISDSQTEFHQVLIDPAPSDTISIEITASKYPRTWQAADPQILALLPTAIRDQDKVLILGNFDQENSRRIADKLVNAKVDYLWLGYQESGQSQANYQYLPTWQQAVSADNHNALRSITLIKKDGQWQMFEGLWDKLP